MQQLKGLKKENKVTEDFILNCSRELLKKAEVQKVPIDLKILASFCDIKKILSKEIQEAGILVPLIKGGAEIYLRKTDSDKKQRFTCCHEIAHTFFPDYQLKPQKRVDRETGEYRAENWVEYLCDLGASELLIPSFLFQPKFFNFGFSIASLIKLSDEFGSSLEATAIKMIKQAPGKTALIIWEEKYKPTEGAIKNSSTLPGLEEYKPQKRLRVKLSCGFEDFGYIPKDKSLEETGEIIGKSFTKNRQMSGIEDISFGNFNVKCEVCTLSLNYQKRRRILSLLSVK